MLDMICVTLMVKFSISANRFVLFIKSIPFLGKKIPSSIYRSQVLKTIMLIIGIMKILITNLFNKSLYCVLLIWLPAKYMQSAVKEVLGLNISISFVPMVVFLLLMFNWLYGSFINTIIMSSDEEKFYMIKLLRCEPRRYYLSAIVQKLFFDVIGFIIPLGLIILFETDTKHGFGLAIYLIFIQECFRIIMEAFCIKLYSKFSCDAGLQNPVKVVFTIIIVPVVVLVPLITNSISVVWMITGNVIFGIVCAFAAFISWRYLMKYDNYSIIAA